MSVIIIFAIADYLHYVRRKGRFARHPDSSIMAGAFEGSLPPQALAVLRPPSGLGNWLKERRPALLQQLEADVRKGDVRVLPALLKVMYGDKGVDVALAIGGSVHLLTPTTARAEAWLCAWEDKGSWGGQRRGAGKPAAPARIKDTTQPHQ